MNLLYSNFAKFSKLTSFGNNGKQKTKTNLGFTEIQSRASLRADSKNLNTGKIRNPTSHTETWIHSASGEMEKTTNPSKTKNLSRWASWINHQSTPTVMEGSDLKPIWNYLLGETGFSDILSYLHPREDEALQMVVEPKNKGLVLYVFWKSKETGAMGIQFHYDPEKEKPILVEITTEQSIQGEQFTTKLGSLVRDFPQIQTIQIETWANDSFNGDYR
ncbi:hypothetical protein [Leptospira brenneri]|uniref:hypothetical protein n=1 Tax=Leptospira brenneri TaxID=2023182 RepID=UPI001AD83AFF|nr:hypothetical protein [Leptospira brenneri]